MEREEAKILEFGQTKDIESLQNYVSGVKCETLKQLLKSRIKSKHIMELLHYTLVGCTGDDRANQQKQFELVNAVLDEVASNDLPTLISSGLVTRLCLVFRSLQTHQLLQLYVRCSKSIQNGNEKDMSWKDLLPEVLNVLSEKQRIEHNDTEMTGADFRINAINGLCMMDWSPGIILSLIVMFIEVTLTKDENLQVVHKLGQCIEKIDIKDLPAFTYQTLMFCKYNSYPIFIRLQYFFNSKFYKDMRALKDTVDSEDIDSIDCASVYDLQQAESTVLYHIYQCASTAQVSIKSYLNSLHSMYKCPETILNPFQILALLTIGSVPSYEELACEIMRSAISRSMQEELKRNESAWFSGVVKKTVDAEMIFMHVLSKESSHLDLIVGGAVNLSLSLMNVGSALGRSTLAVKQWNLGMKILMVALKRNKSVVPEVLKNLSSKIISGSRPHIDFLYLLCRTLPFVLIENHSSVVYLLREVINITPAAPRLVIESVIPLLKFSPTIRDNFILILRKALYAKSMETRQMAVIGFLKLLTKMKISNLQAASQPDSGRSFFSQISQECIMQKPSTSVISNEALCLEILDILQRCFILQADVRSQLYIGMHAACTSNPELRTTVLNTLWNHFLEFYVTAEDELPPLKLSLILGKNEDEATLDEPIGQLIYIISLVVFDLSGSEDDDNTNVDYHLSVFESIVDRMCRSELIHFNLDNINTVVGTCPKSQRNMLFLSELMTVYEALIGYKIYSWSSTSENTAKQISSLFQGYSRLIEFSKTLSKAKAKKGVEKPKKKEDAAKGGEKLKPFQPPSTILNFPTLQKIIQLLYLPSVEWTSTTSANVLKPKKEFHRYILQSVIQQVGALKAICETEVNHCSSYLNLLIEIGSVLNEMCLKKMENLIDFDCTTALLACECFHSILLLINSQFKKSALEFYIGVGSFSKTDELEVHLKELMETYKSIIAIDEDTSEEPDFKKIQPQAVVTLQFFIKQLPINSSYLTEIFGYVKDIIENGTFTNKQMINQIITLWFSTFCKCKEDVLLLEKVATFISSIIGTVDHETTPSQVSYALINEVTALTVLQSICNTVKGILSDVEWLVQRFKDENCILNITGMEEVEKRKAELLDMERSVCCQLSQLISVMTLVSNITVPTGGNTEALLRVLIHLYKCLNLLTKYFTSKCTKLYPAFQSARFDKVVQLAGKKLANNIYNLFLYIDESQQQQQQQQLEDVTQNKKKPTESSVLRSRILRETRSIPKLVYELERFGRNVIALSKKTNVDLTRYTGQGVARDFRIQIPALKEVLEAKAKMSKKGKKGKGKKRKNSKNSDDDDEEEESDQSDAEDETTVEENAEEEEEAEEDVEEEDEEQEARRKSKKRKTNR